jgi:dTDP-4-dehydrorhamnose reductase
MSQEAKTIRTIIGNGKVSQIIRGPKDVIITHDRCEITDIDSVVSVIRSTTGPVINCVAKTNLSWCESNKQKAYDVNTVGAINVLIACSEYNRKLVHISTGCIFDGNDALSTEGSIPQPAVWYTKTKQWADSFITSYGYENYLILRPRHMISSIKHPTNMITKFASMDTLHCHKETNSITCIEDFSLMINHLLKIGAKGVYNCSNTGPVSPYDIASMVKKHIKPDLNIVEIPYSEMSNRISEKRVNVILSLEKLKLTGFTPRSATEALEWCLQNYR